MIEFTSYVDNRDMLSHNDNVFIITDSARVYFYPVFKTLDVDVPVMVSVRFASYTSTLQVFVKIVGVNARDNIATGLIEISNPLTLVMC